MAKYLVTGLGGSGKTTVCEALLAEGANAIDSNNVPGLASWQDAQTQESIEVDASSYIDWDKVAWNWDEKRLKDLVDGNEGLILCGSASNQELFHSLFDKIFVLVLDRATHRKHLLQRSSPYGKEPQMMEELLEEQQEFSGRLLKLGAIAIDARGTPQYAAHQILDHINDNR